MQTTRSGPLLRPAILLAVLLLGALPVTAGVATPHLLPLQGRVTDAAGDLLPTGDLVVRIYDAPTGGSLVHDSGSAFLDAVERGLFAVILGQGPTLSLDNTGSYWLEVAIDGDEIVGDAAGGRLEFYPGGGDHGRPDLEARLAALESELGLKRAPDGAGGALPAVGKAGGAFLANGQLGLGAFAGTGPTGSVTAIMPNQPVGRFATATHGLLLGAIQAYPTVGPVTVVVDAEPDSIGAGWRLTGPAAFDSTGSGDAVLPGLVAGTYTLDWLDVAGWYKECPDPRVVAIPSDSTATFACAYLPGVTVLIDPEPDFLAAGWQLARPGLPDTAGVGDALLTLGAAGTYTLTWLDDPCWVEPFPNPDVRVASGLETLVFSGSYHAGPEILSVTDVGNDQGRQVRVVWSRACYDAVGDSVEITGYALYRRQDAYRKAGAAATAATGSETAPAKSAAGSLDKAAGWDFLATIPARLDPVYQFVAPTLCDSTADAGVCWSVFMVSALTGSVSLFYDSRPDSGYSIDNLAPSAPADVKAAYGVAVVLSWRPSPDADFRCFRVYRDTDPDFTPGPLSLVHSTIDTTWSDPAGGYDSRYKLTAVDFAGNESPAADPGVVTGVGSGPRAGSRLRQNRPNPFNPATTIVFDLATPAAVTVRVYDVSGRLLRTLMDRRPLPAGTHETRWDGRDDAGRPAAAGAYFCRLQAGGFEQTRRMILVK